MKAVRREIAATEIAASPSAPNDMIGHSAIEQRPLVEWPAFLAGRIETKGAVEILAMTLARVYRL